MKIIIDVCLPTDWEYYLQAAGFDAVHWRNIGAASAPDAEIVEWSQVHEAVVLTHDLDFGLILAAGKLTKPSVVQIRDDGPVPEAMGDQVLKALTEFDAQLGTGAIVTVHVDRTRVRPLPLR